MAKVIFLQACVCPQGGVYLVRGGVLSLGGVLSPGGVYLVLGDVLSPRGVLSPGGVLSPRRVWSGGCGLGGCGPGVCGLGGCGLGGVWLGPPKLFFDFFFDFFIDFFGDPPPPEADSGIWSTSGQYASYWNAFSGVVFQFCVKKTAK